MNIKRLYTYVKAEQDILLSSHLAVVNLIEMPDTRQDM